VTSKVKGQGRKVTWRVWQVLADKSRTKQTPKLVGRLPTYGQQCLLVSRSKVKSLGHMVSNTTQQHFISNYNCVYSHSLGGDTSTVTLPARFIVIRYSLGGDTDNINTAWVPTLWVHSCCVTLWPWPLNPKTVSLLGYPKVIPYTKFEHFGIIRFWVMLRTNRQTDRQTNKQTDSKILPTPTDIVGVGNYISYPLLNRDTMSLVLHRRKKTCFYCTHHTFVPYKWQQRLPIKELTDR